MAARRTLGGGRVLGSGRNLAPPSPAPPKKQANRNSGLLSPSESSVSLDSQTSTTPLTLESEDIASRVAHGSHDAIQAAAAAASSKMVCPICSEEMMTLLQLNRHIDDNHGNLEEIEQDQAKSWFKQQMTKARKFQPLAVLNQRLRGLEVFESNDERPYTGTPTSSTPVPSEGAPTKSVAPHDQREEPPDPDEVVNRTHWQRPTGRDACSDPECGKRLGSTNGQINCRCCGKLFCDEHTMYQMKLSRSAQHEPVRGLWCRVCETCYISRDGYNDHTGYTRDHFEYFKATRRKAMDKVNLDAARLETRLTRLTQLLAKPAVEGTQSASDFFWSTVSGSKPGLRDLEQSIVKWEDDATVSQCPFCQQVFSQYAFRRHHCRICGRVVCGDFKTNCSSEVELDVDTQIVTEKTGSQTQVQIRMCKECQRTIFSKADFDRELANQPQDQRAYQHLSQFEYGIRQLLPTFQRLLKTLQDPEKPPTPAQLAQATRLRKRLTDAFTQYDLAARRIRDLPTSSATQEQLQKAIHQQAMSFLYIHMLPLKRIPKTIKHATPNGSPSNSSSEGLQPALASIKFDKGRPGSSRASSQSSAAITALEAEEKQLRERLIVLEEQQFIVSSMIAEANKRRKFDEVSALSGNVADLSQEIDRIRGQLAQMDFAGAYAADAPG